MPGEVHTFGQEVSRKMLRAEGWLVFTSDDLVERLHGERTDTFAVLPRDMPDHDFAGEGAAFSDPLRAGVQLVGEVKASESDKKADSAKWHRSTDYAMGDIFVWFSPPGIVMPHEVAAEEGVVWFYPDGSWSWRKRPTAAASAFTPRTTGQKAKLRGWLILAETLDRLLRRDAEPAQPTEWVEVSAPKAGAKKKARPARRSVKGKAAAVVEVLHPELGTTAAKALSMAEDQGLDVGGLTAGQVKKAFTEGGVRFEETGNRREFFAAEAKA